MEVRRKPTRGGQLFVGIADREAPLIILDDLGQRVARRDPCAKAGAIHREDIALRLALDHPLRKGQPNAAALAEAGHDSAGGPIVAHPGTGPTRGLPSGAKVKGPWITDLITGRFKCRESACTQRRCCLRSCQSHRPKAHGRSPRACHRRPTDGRAVHKIRCKGRGLLGAGSSRPRDPSHGDALPPASIIAQSERTSSVTIY